MYICLYLKFVFQIVFYCLFGGEFEELIFDCMCISLGNFVIDVLFIISCQLVFVIFIVYIYMFFVVKGGSEGMELKGFDDVMMDFSIGLIYVVLIGEFK